jgi:hypothetical protein
VLDATNCFDHKRGMRAGGTVELSAGSSASLLLAGPLEDLRPQTRPLVALSATSLRPSGIVSPALHATPGALRNVGGSAGVPSSSSSLNVSPYAIGLPSVSGWDRTGDHELTFAAFNGQCGVASRFALSRKRLARKTVPSDSV